MRINNDKNKNCEELIKELRENLEEELKKGNINDDEFREQFISCLNTILYQDCDIEYELPDDNKEN